MEKIDQTKKCLWGGGVGEGKIETEMSEQNVVKFNTADDVMLRYYLYFWFVKNIFY